MKLTENKQKRIIKGMIKTFYNNFAWYDLDSIFGKNNDLDLVEFLTIEYPKYTLKECYTALNTMLYNRKLIIKEDSKYSKLEIHGMQMEWL